MKPTVSRTVHYVSYGTPGGEYVSLCRSAVVAEVGAWMQDYAREGADQNGRRYRTVGQHWDEEACALVVTNPTGLFFNTCRHDEGKVAGTWHWPEREDG
jgi:hypothetical protein